MAEMFKEKGFNAEMITRNKYFSITIYSLLFILLVSFFSGCDYNDYYSDYDNNGVENEAEERESDDLPRGNIIDFAEYQAESEHLILAFYEVAKGSLGTAITPEIDYKSYKHYADDLSYSIEELKRFQKTEKPFRLLWEYTTYLLPEEYLRKIYFFEVFTDGVDDTLGSIEDISNRLDDGEEGFIFSLDLSDMLHSEDEINEDLFAETVIHELGHMITLAASQMEPADYEYSNPDTYYLFDDEMDTYPDSYLNLFFQEFWLDIYEEWQEVDYYFLEDEEKFDDLLQEFYEKYETQFVSDYAPTNPVEDIAESFMAFVMQDKPAPNLIWKHKILFFYNFPEMIKVREHYRKNWL